MHFKSYNLICYFARITEEFKFRNTALKSSQTPNPLRVEGTAACADQWTECKALRMRNGHRHGRPFNSHECSRRSPTTLEETFQGHFRDGYPKIIKKTFDRYSTLTKNVRASQRFHRKDEEREKSRHRRCSRTIEVGFQGSLSPQAVDLGKVAWRSCSVRAVVLGLSTWAFSRRLQACEEKGWKGVMPANVCLDKDRESLCEGKVDIYRSSPFPQPGNDLPPLA
ncbi:hypothetical protein K0M31_002784 [Melipona bicolor]|uniref:Uncharacterized protein n=1 Tax=Melipona bicolor TaxID=60889 RepID=A0AA40FZM4_9HYME|nr:hypothetical protein K0M31_002784 [Melipona bicolor]